MLFCPVVQKQSCGKIIHSVLPFSACGKTNLLGENYRDVAPFHHITVWEHLSSVADFHSHKRGTSHISGQLCEGETCLQSLNSVTPLHNTLCTIFEVTLYTFSSSSLSTLYFQDTFYHQQSVCLSLLKPQLLYKQFVCWRLRGPLSISKSSMRRNGSDRPLAWAPGCHYIQISHCFQTSLLVTLEPPAL